MATRREFLAWLAGGTFGAVGAVAGAVPAAAGTGITVLTGATLIDGTGSPPAPDTVLVLAGEEVIAVGRHPARPRGVRVVDLGGRFVIPGLWDVHTHGAWLVDTFLPLHVANGVTGIRDMGGPGARFAIRDAVDRGELLGPRMVLASHLVDGPLSPWAGLGDGVVEVRTEAEARAAVVGAVRQRADFVKVYSHLFPGPYAAAAAEAARLGIAFAGHVPMQVSAQDAVRRGQHTVEHLYTMALSTSSRRHELLDRMRTAFAGAEDAGLWARTSAELEHEALATHDPAVAASLYRSMRRAGTWQCPTLGVERTFLEAAETLADPRLRDLLERYVHPSTRAQWSAQVTAVRDRPPAETARARAVFGAKVRMVGELDRAGVGVVAGTDSWIPFRFPGFSLHDELAQLVAAGLSPMRALQSATRDAARCLGRQDRSGTVAPGKPADLVVLDADPLADIGNVRRVHSVVHRGRYITPAERTRLLADAEAAAQHDPPERSAVPATPRCCS
ncbi:amidohydrolase family protein [Saccharothrix sp. Mg75]|uniref:amidohydrolase family protein n=1 Tax=Saccharothrix sp. Mg75 TaxID=3445357 RepID=UPI003EEA6AE9